MPTVAESQETFACYLNFWPLFKRKKHIVLRLIRTLLQINLSMTQYLIKDNKLAPPGFFFLQLLHPKYLILLQLF